jgi:hypothetical protein
VSQDQAGYTPARAQIHPSAHSKPGGEPVSGHVGEGLGGGGETQGVGDVCLDRALSEESPLP